MPTSLSNIYAEPWRETPIPAHSWQSTGRLNWHITALSRVGFQLRTALWTPHWPPFTLAYAPIWLRHPPTLPNHFPRLPNGFLL